jgi:AcrR family transcriptional regulator
MGNREDLLAAAKHCLIEKGYARTTTRDIAKASGVSLAAIGYHFGSKDALMNQAVYESIGDWSDELRRSLSAEGGLDAGALRRFESIMERTIESFAGENAGLWAAQVELMSLLNHNAELRTFIAGVQGPAASGLAELFLGIDEEAEPELARVVGSVYHALFIGVIAKWFMDPKQALTAHELAQGLRIIADRICADPSPGNTPTDETA